MKRRAPAASGRCRDEERSASMLVKPVVLCGGSGSRLWPLSNAQSPKQLLSVQAPETLLQGTARRCSGPGFRAPIIVTAEEHRLLVADQLREAAVQPGVTILEPARRNTGAAVALACHLEAEETPEQVLLVVPADHLIADAAAFRKAVSDALPAALRGSIVTFGIEPTRAETGFGYIEAGDRLPGCGDVRKVARFIEKPDCATAAAYVAGGKHLWNAGILLARAATLVAELRAHAPELSRTCEAAIRSGIAEGGFLRPDRSLFLSAPAVSIDCAVMEKTDRACVLPVDMRWSDVGSWDALWQISDRDGEQNAISGPVVARDTSGCLIRSEGTATIAALGVTDLVIVATGDGVLVAGRDRAQDIKQVVEDLGNDTATAAAMLSDAHASADEIEAMEIILPPGRQLALVPRDTPEHWIVNAGTASVTIGADARLVRENETAFVPRGSSVTIENHARTPLHLVQVRRVSKVRFDAVPHQRDGFAAVA